MSEPNQPDLHLVPSTPQVQSLPATQPRNEPPLFVPCAPGLGRPPAANDPLGTASCLPISELAIRSTE